MTVTIVRLGFQLGTNYPSLHSILLGVKVCTLLKIAYLILCHMNEQQIVALIHQLQSDYADIYVHVDSKTDGFELLRKERIILLDDDERIDVRWASFSMIEATMKLIKKCLSNQKKYDYILLISGQDFPIKNHIQRLSFLEDNRGSNYIEIKPHDDSFRRIFPKRNELYYPSWMYGNSIFIRIIRKFYIIMTGGRSYTFRLFKRKNTTGMTFEFGSQWWCLQAEVVEWMMKYINDHPEYVAFFKNAMTPDECFFQTLFVNSPYAKARKDKLVWLEWKGNHPRLIEEKDIDRLISVENVLFARKFDLKVNPKPIEMLIEQLKE